MERFVPILALAVTAGCIGVPTTWLAIGVLLLLALDRLRRAPRRGRVVVMALVVGGGLIGDLLSAAEARRVDEVRASATWMDGLEHPFTAVVTSLPRQTRSGWRMSVRLDAPSPAQVSLFMTAPCPPYRVGDRIRGRARFDAWRPPVNPGEFDLRRHRLVRGLSGRGRVRVPPSIIGAGPSDAGALAPSLADLRLRIRRGIHRGTSSAEARGLALALTLGERGALPDALRDDFVRAGIAHLLAISGLHLALGALLVAGVVRLLLLPFAARLPPRALIVVPALASVPLVLLQTALAGAPPSCLRAATMILHLTAARVFERRADAATAIGLAALVNLTIAPGAAQEVGFQLSFGASGAILWCLSRRTETGGAPRRIQRVVLLARVSAAAFLGTAPFVAWHFGALPLAAPLVNLVAVPIASFALLPGALLLGLSSAATGHVPQVLTWFFEAATQAEAALASLAAAVGPSAVLIPRDAPWLSVLCGGLLRALRGTAGAGTLIVIAAASAGLLFGALAPTSRPTEAWLLDVGEGNMAVLRLGCGRVLVLDGGPPGSGRRTLLPFLRSQGIRRVDDLVITHAHTDHYAGALEVYRDLGAPRIITNGSPLIHRALDEHLPDAPADASLACPGEGAWGLCDLQLHFISPGVLDQDLDENDRSLIVYLTQGPLRILFTGDMGPRGWTIAAPLLPPGWVSLLQVPHHGHRSPHLSPLLSATNPLLSFAFSDGSSRNGGNMGVRRIMKDYSFRYHISGLHGPLHIEATFPTILFRTMAEGRPSP